MILLNPISNKKTLAPASIPSGILAPGNIQRPEVEGLSEKKVMSSGSRDLRDFAASEKSLQDQNNNVDQMMIKTN
ncbi:MAG TPA: hypothetical protein VKR32_00305 [Puia sp.]|nr:hypothetical protein [Puia sp.]